MIGALSMALLLRSHEEVHTNTTGGLKSFVNVKHATSRNIPRMKAILSTLHGMGQSVANSKIIFIET
jgi:hypothetical protein